MSAVAVVACLVAAAAAALRWLRVAQREHYLAGSCTRFAGRWWTSSLPNTGLTAVGVAGLALTPFDPGAALLVAAVAGAGPLGLALRGRAPGPMAWTARARRLAAIWAGLTAVVVLGGLAIGAGPVAGAIVAAGCPVLVDAALVVASPVERRRGRVFVERAKERLAAVDPLVLAVTGSYGKTSTKGYAAHLIGGTRSVVPTPASYNNALGLARAVNEGLPPGTEVFVAEMGTYGPGEIAAMCEWVRPTVSAITAIGPVHLERMRSEDRIAAAKAEIFTTASVAVLNVDHPLLADLAPELEARGLRVVRCTADDPTADVVASPEDGTLVVRVGGEEIARSPAGDHAPTNVAIAVALALEAGVPPEHVGARVATLPTAASRRSIATGSTGATLIDDTYNSNPAGAHAALRTLERLATSRDDAVVVTPGMVELGPRQFEENRRFGEAAAAVAARVVVIGRTNRRALVEGASGAAITVVPDRAAATAWVRASTGPGDVVLFENDLPDHFP